MPRTVFPLVVVVAAVIAQSPALGHFFRADDFIHLYEIEDYSYWGFILKPHGGHVLPTTLTVFYLCRVLFGLDATGYYVLAIATHALNVYLLYRIIETSTRRNGLALAAALIWGTSSLNQGSVGWFSVYGHLLAGTWTHLFLYGVARVASGERALTRTTAWLWLAYMLGAATSFGVGIPIAMLSGPALFLLLSPDVPGRARALRTLGALLFVVPALFFALHWAHSNSSVANMLSLPTVWGVLSMFTALFTYGTLSLTIGSLLASTRSLWATSAEEVSWIVYGVGAALALALAYSVRRIDQTMRSRAIAYLLLACGCYGIVALGRSSFYIDMGISETVAGTTVRYHYLGPAILTVLFAFLAAGLFRPIAKPRPWVATVAAALLLGTNWAASRSVNTALTPDRGKLYAKTIESLEARIYSGARGSNVVIDNTPFIGAGYGANVFPGLAGVFLIRFPENEVDERRVYFIERDPKRFEFWNRFGGERLQDLLIAPHSGEGRPKHGRRDVIGDHRGNRLN